MRSEHLLGARRGAPRLCLWELISRLQEPAPGGPQNLRCLLPQWDASGTRGHFRESTGSPRAAQRPCGPDCSQGGTQGLSLPLPGPVLGATQDKTHPSCCGSRGLAGERVVNQ